MTFSFQPCWSHLPCEHTLASLLASAHLAFYLGPLTLCPVVAELSGPSALMASSLRLYVCPEVTLLVTCPCSELASALAVSATISESSGVAASYFPGKSVSTQATVGSPCE